MRYLQLFEKFYNPPLYIKKKIDSIVDELLKKYGGGRQFFDALDDAIKDVTSVDMIIALLRGNSNEYIVSTGEFGDILHTLYLKGKIDCKGVVVFNGKINTLNLGANRFYPESFDISDKKFVFVDDSLFSGKTYQRIEEFLKKHNSSIKSINVIYDGSKEKNDKVKSFFRYYV